MVSIFIFSSTLAGEFAAFRLRFAYGACERILVMWSEYEPTIMP